MIVTRLGPLSLARVAGVLYAILGLLVGCVFAFVSMIGAAAAPGMDSPFVGIIFGVGAVFILPLMYGAFGFFGSLLFAALYNVVASAAGGVEIQLEESRPGAGHP